MIDPLQANPRALATGAVESQSTDAPRRSGRACRRCTPTAAGTLLQTHRSPCTAFGMMSWRRFCGLRLRSAWHVFCRFRMLSCDSIDCAALRCVGSLSWLIGHLAAAARTEPNRTLLVAAGDLPADVHVVVHLVDRHRRRLSGQAAQTTLSTDASSRSVGSSSATARPTAQPGAMLGAPDPRPPDGPQSRSLR